MDHWSNIDTAIDLLTGNLMWTAPPQVYAMSIKILDVIVKEATFSQSAPILTKLIKGQYYLREAFEEGQLNDRQRMFWAQWTSTSSSVTFSLLWLSLTFIIWTNIHSLYHLSF